MPDEKWAFASLPELGAQLRSGTATSVALTEFFLDRLERFGPRFGAVVTLTRELALEQAKQADADLKAGRDRGPLHGLPYGAKDLLATRGIPTTWGAAPLKDQVFDEDATVVVRLRDAGAVLAAKLSMIELAGGFGYRQANASLSGPGRCAWDDTCWAGGSSSGPGSAVGAGLVPFAIGSETSGSIMTPAALNGITGMRPTYGLVSRHGAMALSWTMDKLGPMGHSIEDCGLVLAAIAGPDPLDATSLADGYRYQPENVADRKPRVGIIEGCLKTVEDEVRKNFEAAVEVYRQFAEVTEVKLPDLPYGAVVGTVISCEMAAAFETFIRDGQAWELTAPEDRWGGHSTLAIPAKDYINALRVRRKIQIALDELLSRFDALIAPTLATVAGPIDREFREWSRGFASSQLGVAANVAGLPGASIPIGPGARGLPTGMQLVGRTLSENRLFGVAAEYQRRTEWHRRHPEIP
ncbi:MAG: amidase [Planctomycetaceae bacterium]|nr:amidase [Planctomycetaceae bacterium]